MLVTSQDPAVTAIRGTERHMKILRRSGKIPVIGQASATSKVAQRIAWRNLLILSVDCRGLTSHPEVARIRNPGFVIVGSHYAGVPTYMGS